MPTTHREQPHGPFSLKQGLSLLATGTQLSDQVQADKSALHTVGVLLVGIATEGTGDLLNGLKLLCALDNHLYAGCDGPRPLIVGCYATCTACDFGYV